MDYHSTSLKGSKLRTKLKTIIKSLTIIRAEMPIYWLKMPNNYSILYICNIKQIVRSYFLP